MSAAIADRELDVTQDVRVIHALRGRLRVHLVNWTGKGQWRIESRLRAVPGVQSAQANPLTGNVLIQYDHTQIDEVGVLEALDALCGQLPALEAEAAAARPPAHVQTEGKKVRARISVRGLDRSPHLAQHVVERLQRFPGVQARANPLTGRVLVEFAKHETDIEELIAEVADVELPETPEEDRPADPLDPAPLIQGVTRTVGAALGLGLIAAQQLPGVARPLVDPTIPAYISSVIGILRGFPFLRDGLRNMFGRNAADFALSVPNIATLALSNNAPGLAVTGAESAILMNEVHSRQAAWRHYEENLQNVAAATPGAVVRLESGETCPLDAHVIEGFGTCADRSARPTAVAPGQRVTAGSRLFGGPFVLEMQASEGFEPQERPAPLTLTLYDQYNRIVAPASLGYALATAVLTRSLSRTFMALLLVNPRVAIIGMEAANLDASTRVLRAGVIVPGTRPERTLRRPDTVLLDGPRLVSERFEATSIVPLVKDIDTAELLALAGGVAAVAGSPWGGALRSAVGVEAVDGHFDGSAASARIRGVTYTLRPLDDFAAVPEAAPLRQRGDHVLQLTSEREQHPLGLLALRPRLVSALQDLIDVCRRQRVLLALLPGNDALTARAIAQRAGIAVLDSDDALGAIQSRQAQGKYIAFVSDGAHAGRSFDACDLAIGLTDGRSPLAARADLLAPDLTAVAAIVEAGARRDAAVRDSVGFSAVANVSGAVWGFRGAPGIETASTIVYGAALAALADGWWRLRGGERPRKAMAQIVDPRPERWGDRTVESTLETLHTSEDGLSTSQAAVRRQQAPPMLQQRTLSSAIMEQLKSPLNVMLGAGAGISLLLGTPADVVIIGATVAANVFIGAWQERRASQVAQTLNRLGAVKARVLRDGRPVLLPAGDVVPGDVLLLGAGDRITADARLIESQGLEVDEAALTGESLPVLKAPDSPSNAARVVLDGSDITTGSGRAVAFAVGGDTRMGSITAALAAATEKESPLDQRLSQLVGQLVPLAIGGGAIVAGAGWLRTRALLPQLAIGGTIAITAIPEGLPLLTKISEAGVARRLADRNALTRRLPAVETLGRVDVACTDKTGTLTQGRLSLRLIATAADDDCSAEVRLPLPPDRSVSNSLRTVLRAAALASPHPEAEGAAAHPTDVAVTSAAETIGLGEEIRRERESELPFDPARAFHAAVVGGHLYVKGAPEALIPRCVALRRVGDGGEPYDEPLDDATRERLLARAEAFAAQGLRMLMVAEGSQLSATGEQTELEAPHDLVAIGFVGISDPLKPTVPATVRRCREAGVRVIMITGDHPSTARSIAREAGLLDGVGDDGSLLTGTEIAELHNGDLDAALERAGVIARATPLDKVRIVESLQRRGHTVAMTGDGVNDAPALRLADVGVAMGRGGTEVARQIADVVLADDDFSTLVEALVEGRSFWHNTRRALGLLLGGNLGELGLVVGATALGFAVPMTARQILIVNMITDLLPGLAVALQPPEHRNLAGLAREGTSALAKPLTNEVMRRGGLTAGPSLAAYVLSRLSGTPAQAQTVAFASVIATQLAQTLDAGWSEGHLTNAMVGAVGGSAAFTAGALALPPLRQFVGLALPGPAGWVLIGGSTLAALALSRLLAAPQLPAPSTQQDVETGDSRKTP